jgi:hypothetical protein
MKKLRLFCIILCVIVISLVSSVSASISCGNFTNYESQYKKDCKYIEKEDLSFSEKQLVLSILLTESYEYRGELWEHTPSQIKVPDYKAKSKNLDNDTLFLAWDIFILCLLNYTIFSILTKSSVFLKWLNVDF